MAVSIVTDSTCDLSPAQAASLGIDLVPIVVKFGDKEFRDGVDITLADFYKRLDPNGELPVTAPPTPDAFAQVFRRHVQPGGDVICLTVSSKLSKNFEFAGAAAKEFNGKVRVIDTKTLSGGLGLIASGAARLAGTGADSATISGAINNWMRTQRGYAIYPDLRFLAKSGRINKAQLVLGTVMHLFPVTRVSVDGALESETTVKSWDQAKEMLASITSRKLERPAQSRVFVTHTNSPDQAQVVADELRKKLSVSPKELSIYAAGPTIGANVGPGSLGIFMLEE